MWRLKFIGIWRIEERHVSREQELVISSGRLVRTYWRCTQRRAERLADQIGSDGALVIPSEKFAQGFVLTHD